MDETVKTPDTEVKEVVGTVEAELNKVAPEEKKPTPETVPLAVYLELKDDVKELKKELKESKGSSKTRVEIQGVGELAKKYPDVNEEFIQDMLNSATIEATKKIEEKYTPIIEKQEQEKKQIAFDQAFDKLYEDAKQANPDLPQTMDKELIKELAMTPKYRNTPVADILVKMYATTVSGKSSSEDDMRTGAERVEDVVNFDKITPEQRKAVMADDKARAKYFTWLDNQTGR